MTRDGSMLLYSSRIRGFHGSLDLNNNCDHIILLSALTRQAHEYTNDVLQNETETSQVNQHHELNT